jgi:hypothetical protein
MRLVLLAQNELRSPSDPMEGFSHRRSYEFLNNSILQRILQLPFSKSHTNNLRLFIIINL